MKVFSNGTSPLSVTSSWCISRSNYSRHITIAVFCIRCADHMTVQLRTDTNRYRLNQNNWYSQLLVYLYGAAHYNMTWNPYKWSHLQLQYWTMSYIHLAKVELFIFKITFFLLKTLHYQVLITDYIIICLGYFVSN